MPEDESDPYLVQLRELPFVDDVRRASLRSPQGYPTPDGALELTLADGDVVRFLYEVKSSHLAADTAEHLNFPQRPDALGWILMAPYIGGPLGSALENRGINFVDREGNCHLKLGTRHLARIQGRLQPSVPASRKELRAPGQQVMFALLAEPELLEASQREIAAAAGTSRQPVADLLARFVEEGLVVRRKRAHRWVAGPNAALLERWVAGYRATLRPKLEVGRFRMPVRHPEEVEAWLEERLGPVRYGGTAGGYRLQPHYRGPLTMVHLGPASEEIRRRLKALASPDGDLIWMRHIGQLSAKGRTPDTVHPILIYAELMVDPDPRAGETAQLVREKWLPWSL